MTIRSEARDRPQLVRGSHALASPGQELARHVRAFDAIVRDDAFPCHFARHAMLVDDLLFGSVTAIENITMALRRVVDVLEASPAQVVVLFFPQAPAATVTEAFRSTRRIFETIHVGDRTPWPSREPTDPANAQWAFHFAGVDLFINVSAPSHERRRSRNLGPALTWVIQRRSSFAAHPGVTGDVRSRIRRKVASYDGIPAHPALGSFGDAENREADQYFLPESNSETLRIHPCRSFGGGAHD